VAVKCSFICDTITIDIEVDIHGCGHGTLAYDWCATGLVNSFVAHVAHAWGGIHRLVDVSLVHRLPMFCHHIAVFSSLVRVNKVLNSSFIFLDCSSLLNDSVVGSGASASSGPIYSAALFAAYDLILEELSEMAILLLAATFRNRAVKRAFGPRFLSARKH